MKCELETPSENLERWIHELIQINKRIRYCHPSQKKSDITMIAHVLSKFPKDEKYYKNFVAMHMKFGYNKHSIMEFNREVYDYWECNIQGMAEVEEDEQVHMVQSHKVQMKRGEHGHGIKQEGNYYGDS